MTNELFESAILPMVQIPETPQYYLDSFKCKATKNATTYGFTDTYNPIKFDVFNINNSFQLKNQSITNDFRIRTYFNPAIYGEVEMVFSINVDFASKFDTIIEAQSLNYITKQTTNLTAGINNFSIKFNKTAADSAVSFAFDTSGSPGTFITLSGTVDFIFSPQKLVENNTVFVSECLPKISKKDFLLTIVNQYNLMLKVDSLNRTIDFSYFNSVEANKANAIDLSDKMDLTDLPTIQYKLDGYAQNNELNYETDENDEELRKVNNYGQGIIFCNNLSIDKTKEIFRSKFAPITRKLALKSPHSVEMAFIHLWVLSETTFRTQNVKPRIGYVYNNGEILDLYSTSGEGGGGHGAGHHDSSPSKGVYFEKMQFSSGLIPNYYKILVDMLQDVYFMKGNFKIRLKEFMEIDFLKPIFLSLSVKGFGLIEGYFYCNKINQFKINRNESTEIELIKI
jgi:hypothetical protein